MFSRDDAHSTSYFQPSSGAISFSIQRILDEKSSCIIHFLKRSEENRSNVGLTEHSYRLFAMSLINPTRKGVNRCASHSQMYTSHGMNE